MNFKENILLAFAGLKSNKMRAFLTMLGIIIGISSVIMITTLGSIVEKGLGGVVSDLGVSNLVEIFLTARTDSTREGVLDSDFITEEMIMDIEEHFGDDIKSTHLMQGCGGGTIIVDKEVVNFTATGYSEDGAATGAVDLVKGRYIKEEDIKREKKVCVIPDELAILKFGSIKGAIGQTLELTMANTANDFSIIGVYEQKASGFAGMMVGPNHQIHIPISVAQRITGAESLYYYVDFTGADDINVMELSTDVVEYVNEKFYKDNDSFEVMGYTMKEEMEVINQFMGILQAVLSIIAGISLLVGGIGVMNIMLVSVTERTREIGVRKALGAPNSAIRIQFIVESVIICSIGGIIGILSGVLLGNLIGLLLKQTAIPSISAIIVAVTFSMGIGVFFGYYPANKAAKLDPIEALRYE